jgi:hypothetical protein
MPSRNSENTLAAIQITDHCASFGTARITVLREYWERAKAGALDGAVLGTGFSGLPAQKSYD